MEPDVLEFAHVMSVIVLSAVAFVVIGLGARLLWRLGSRTPRTLPTDSGQLQHLQMAVDAMAIEVERISEGQRFTVALLSDRLPARDNATLLRAAPQRYETPH